MPVQHSTVGKNERAGTERARIRPPLSELEPLPFNDFANEWTEDFEAFSRLAAGCSSVLDLGCGAGLGDSPPGPRVGFGGDSTSGVVIPDGMPG